MEDPQYEMDFLEEAEMMRYRNATQGMKNQVKAYDILIPPIGTFIIVTNLIVVLSSGLILKRGVQPICTYMFLGNVAMADFVTAMTVVMGTLYPKALITDTMCTIHLGLIVSCTITSNFSVGLVALDRFLYISHGIKYKLWMYVSRARLMIKISWILGLIIGFLPAMGWRKPLKNPLLCWYILIAPKNLIIFTAILGIFLPIFLVIVLYSIILYEALKKVIQLRRIKDMGKSKTIKITQEKYSVTDLSVICIEMEDTKYGTHVAIKTRNDGCQTGKIIKMRTLDDNIQLHDDKRNPRKWKAIKVVMFTTFSFTCTWLPYFIACFIYVHCDPQETPLSCKKVEYAIASPLAILGLMNSLFNPLIYAWWHNGFRNTFKTMCWRKNVRLKETLYVINRHDERTAKITLNR